MIKIKTQVDAWSQKEIKNNHWQWCKDNLSIGTWKMMFGFTGTTATFCFDNEEDATAFKLRFGL